MTTPHVFAAVALCAALAARLDAQPRPAAGRTTKTTKTTEEAPTMQAELEMMQRGESADASEVEEYEKLLSQRFTTDPDVPVPESAQQGAQDDRSRMIAAKVDQFFNSFTSQLPERRICREHARPP